MSEFPLPGMGESVVAVPAPGRGPKRLAGAPSAALDADGSFVLADRLRVSDGDRAETVVACSEDDETFETVCTLDKSRWDARSLERPALVRTAVKDPVPGGGHRIYYEWPVPGQSHELRTELVAP